MTDGGELLVAAYCRVSTDRTDQANSLRSQREYFYTYITGRPGWRLAQVYADEGLSGTSIRRRAAFQRMMEDAAAGKFGLILTKEVSRFARNTVDTLACTRRLKEAGVGVVFLSDGIDTRDNDGELRLTIMASMAQEESRKTSQRVKWGQRRRMEAGVVFGSDSTYGFETRGGALTVRPAEAEVIRLIYHKYLAEGKGAHVIARELNQAGIAPPRAERWSENTILRMLRNEKYAGDLRQKKYITVDYLTHRKVENRGQEEQLYLRDHHQAIVSRETWEGVQRELKRRSAARQGGERHSARYWPSGRVWCGGCGAPYIPRTSRRKDGSVYKSWGCRRSGEKTEPAERTRKQREAERRLRRALEGYLDGVITAKELEEVRAQCSAKPDMTEAEEQERGKTLPMPEVSDGLWEDILRETVARVTVYPDSLELIFQAGEKSLQIWYSTEGKGESYQTNIHRWKEKRGTEK